MRSAALVAASSLAAGAAALDFLHAYQVDGSYDCDAYATYADDSRSKPLFFAAAETLGGLNASLAAAPCVVLWLGTNPGGATPKGDAPPGRLAATPGGILDELDAGGCAVVYLDECRPAAYVAENAAAYRAAATYLLSLGAGLGATKVVVGGPASGGVHALQLVDWLAGEWRARAAPRRRRSSPSRTRPGASRRATTPPRTPRPTPPRTPRRSSTPTRPAPRPTRAASASASARRRRGVRRRAAFWVAHHYDYAALLDQYPGGVGEADAVGVEKLGATLRDSAESGVRGQASKTSDTLFSVANHGTIAAVDRDLFARRADKGHVKLKSWLDAGAWGELRAASSDPLKATLLAWIARGAGDGALVRDACDSFLCNPTCPSSIAFRSPRNPPPRTALRFGLGSLFPVALLAMLVPGHLPGVWARARKIERGLAARAAPGAGDRVRARSGTLARRVAPGTEGALDVIADAVADLEGDATMTKAAYDETLRSDLDKMVLRCDGLSYWAPRRRGAPPFRILHGVSTTVAQRSITAVMGPSGSGKSTLLEVVCGARTAGSIAGDLALSGASLLAGGPSRRLRDWYRTSSAFVPQQDVFLASLTVRQFAAHLALLVLPAGLETAAKARAAYGLLERVRLHEALDTRIGDGGVAIQGGLSGGQRRRLSVFQHTLAAKQFLFLDEPTSGLDATSSLVLLACLDAMKNGDGGKCVVLTIHQPRQEVFDYMDQVVVLVKGRVAYDGRRGGLDVIWRHNPDVADIVAGAEGVSPPDLMLDVLDAVQSRGVAAIEAHVRLMEEHAEPAAEPLEPRTRSMPVADRLARIADLKRQAGFSAETGVALANTRVRYVAALLFRRRVLTHGFSKFVGAMLRRAYRRAMYLALLFATIGPSVLALLCASFQNYLLEPTESAVYEREVAAGQTSLAPHVAALWLFDSSSALLYALLFALPLWPLAGMPSEYVPWLLLITCMHAVAIAAVMQGILCWLGLGKPRNMPALSVGNALVLVFSGLAVHVQDAWPAMRPFVLLSPNTWANAAIARTAVWRLDDVTDFYGKANLSEWLQNSGVFGVAQLGYDATVLGVDLTTGTALGVLVAWHVAARALGLLGFWVNNREQRIRNRDAGGFAAAERDVAWPELAPAKEAYAPSSLGVALDRLEEHVGGNGARTWSNVLLFSDFYFTAADVCLGASEEDGDFMLAWRVVSTVAYVALLASELRVFRLSLADVLVKLGRRVDAEAADLKRACLGAAGLVALANGLNVAQAAALDARLGAQVAVNALALAARYALYRHCEKTLFGKIQKFTLLAAEGDDAPRPDSGTVELRSARNPMAAPREPALRMPGT
ncbi:ABC transporter [Aureococcus anophagefferens]|nr:ABC transporter [Aureococcus anophagefferens]